MTSRRSPRLLLSSIAAGVLLALTGGAVFAVTPSFNRDAGGAPRAVEEQPAALSITVRTCPANYDPTAPDADFGRDCREPAGDTLFSLDREGIAGPSASTGTSGDAPQESTVRFSEVIPGRYALSASAPAEIAGAFVGSCNSDVRSFKSYPFVPFAVVGTDGRIAIALQAGETLECDWYQVLTPRAGP